MRRMSLACAGDPLETPELFADRNRVVLVVQDGRTVKDCR